MTDDDERVTHIARARSIKAFKLSRVLLRTLQAFPDFEMDDLRNCGPGVRALTAEKAGTRLPSDETWDLACEMVGIVRARETPPSV
jgi:hypothetical protein